jgi:hypothetical protein
MTLEQLTKNGFKPLRTVMYGKKIRGGVVGYHMTTKDGKLWVSTVYLGGRRPMASHWDEPEFVRVYGEPCPLPGFSVYMRKISGKGPGIYNAAGERVGLELVKG